MGLLRDLAYGGRTRSLYRAPRYLTARPIRVGQVFGPVKRATALAWRDVLSISKLYPTSNVGRRNFYIDSSLPMQSYPSGADRRMYHPMGKLAPAVDINGVPSTPTDTYVPNWERLMTPPRKIDWRPKMSTQLKNAPWWYGFVNADKVWICLQRKMRREVMHALGIAGQSGNQNSPHYGPYSRVRC